MSAPDAQTELPISFALPGVITIATVDTVADSLKQLPLAASRCVLDAAATEVITTPGVQLLLAFARTLEASGITLSIVNFKPAFAQTFEQLGLASSFHQWSA